jgi:ABC-type nitrate/sulfonate/bicarbonate transport system substrate-binding protein
MVEEVQQVSVERRSYLWMWIVGIVIIAVLIGAYFLFYSGNGFGSDDELVLGAEGSLLPAAVWIAENKGYFEESKLDLTIKIFDSGRLSFLDMLDGGADISTVAPTPIMFKSFERDDFSIFATFVYSYNDVKVVVAKDKGISKIEDLKGKKIGTPAGTTGQFFVEAFLSYNDISDSEVEVVDISPSDLPGALNKREVDAIVIWEPHAYNAQKLLGDNALRLPSSGVYKETFNFMVMDDFVEENPEVLKKFLEAIDRATNFIKDNKKESQEIVAQRLNLDRGVTNILWEDFVFELSLDSDLITTLEDEARWAIDGGLTEKTEVPNYLDYIYFDVLEDVDSSLVTLGK